MRLIASLSDEQQHAVEEFVRYIQIPQTKETDLDVAQMLDTFVREHEDLHLASTSLHKLEVE